MSYKILVVEDDRDLIAAIALRLRAERFDVIGVSDAYAAMQTAQKSRPDLILMDIGLPGGNGLSVLRRIKTLPHLASMPVVVMTARDRESWEGPVLEAGADGFLAKPIDNAELLSVLKRLLPEHSEPAPSTPSRPKVMLIEDDGDLRHGLALRLKASGFDVVAAADAISALTVAVRENPALILLDLGLPGGNGFLLLDRIRNIPQLIRIPVIVLSAQPAATSKERALHCGAVGYFEKPHDNDALMSEIQKHIAA